MAEFRQGYLDDYSQNSTGVGIGTSSASDAKFEIVGGTTSQELNVTGIATFGSVSGFIKKHTTYTENVNINAGDSGTLSGEIIVGAGLTMTVGTSVTSSQGSVDSLKVSNMFQPPSGTTNQRPAGKPGALFYNFDFKTIEFFDGNSWRQVDNTTTRGRAVHGGGADPSPNSYTGFMSVFEMATQGNAIDFGSLLKAGQGHDGFSSSTRGFFTGRKTPSANPDDDIEYFTIASGGQTIFFGNLTTARRLAGTFSSSTRGIVAEGITPSNTNIIDYVEISTLGDALDFGDSIAIGGLNAGCSSPVKGIFNGGRTESGTWVSRVEEVTIASKGNSVKFGDLTVAPGSNAAFSNSVRGFFAGGHTNPNYNAIDPAPVDSISLLSGGNAVRFGDLSSKRTSTTGTASQTRGFVLGGYYEGSISNVIEFMTLATAGSIADFGDLVNKLESGGSLSDSHGGLGGY